MNATTPLVSVIVPCVNGLPVVAECVEHLLAQKDAPLPDVIVVDRTGEDVRTTLRRRFPHVTVIAAGADDSIPKMRSLGLAHASGRVVGVIEDHCLVGPGWAAAVARSFDQGCQAVGGPVENGSTGRLVD